jgi:hypothetical protein
VGPHPNPSKRKIITLLRAPIAAADRKPVNGAQTAAGVVRAGEGPKVHPTGPTRPGARPTAAWAARKVKRAQALTWLTATHPAVFSAVAKPLALGTGKSVWPAAKAAGIKRAAFNAAMKFHVGSARYLSALTARGAMRFDLAGNAIEPVSDDHRARAIEMKVELEERTRARIAE